MRLKSQAVSLPPRIPSLKKRAEYLRVSASGRKFITDSFILLAAPRPLREGEHACVHLGLTVTRKMGGAVIRNRIRRRLREAFRTAAPELAQAGHDYVLIARKNALLCEFTALIRDLQFALPRVHRVRSARPKDAS